MLNQVVFVGRIVSVDDLRNNMGEGAVSVKIAVQRSYKNEEGIYETDFIPVDLWGGIAQNTLEYCKKGDLIGIKGRIETRDNLVKVIADKVTFLSSQPRDAE